MIQIDSREHQKVIDGIKKAFDAAGEKWFVSKLYVGDYMNYDNPRLVIDRKQNLSELCGNVCQQHERFRAEIIRANEAGIKLVFLCEHGKGIEKLDDLAGKNVGEPTGKEKSQKEWYLGRSGAESHAWRCLV